MRLLLRALGTAVGVLLALPPGSGLSAQPTTGSVVVTVTDAGSKRPVEAAQVFLAGTTFGGQTNGDGRANIRAVRPGDYTVRVLRVGYQEQSRKLTVAAGAPTTLEIALAQVAVSLTPVVTTATGQQRRIELGNATSSIDATKVMESSPVGNINDLLNSRAPGVTVTSGTQSGTGARIRIRGMNSVSLNNEPIWIIDGVRMTSNNGSFSTATGNGAGGNTGGNNASRVGDLNPEEIENIEVVKGPAAATLYGTDAANGVILVTTKKGRAGATRWNVYGEGGSVYDRNTYPTAYSTWGKRPGETVSSRAFCNLQRIGTGECLADSTSALNIFEESDLTPLRASQRQQYGAQVSGGTELLRYFLSAETENEIGVLGLPEFERNRFDSTGLKIAEFTDRPNATDRKSIRLNVNASPTSKLDLGMSTNFVRVAQRYTLESNSTAGLGSHVFGGPGTRNNGTVSGLGTALNGYRGWTPGYMWQERTTQDVNRFIWSMNAAYRPTSWWQNRLVVGQDWTGRNDENFLARGEGPPLTATTRLGSRGLNRVFIQNFTVDAGSTASYDWHDWVAMKTTAGAQYIGYSFSSAATGANQLAPGSQNVASGTQPIVAEGTTRQRTFGAYIEQAVAFNDKLFFTAAVRSDQNSAFGTNFQSIVYPKFSASWLISDQSFWKAPGFINSLRLRYAYGQSGVQPGPNDALFFYTAGTANIANADQPTLIQGALGNDDLKPERSAEHEMGFEAQLFRQRVSLDATYYSKITTDALISAVLPPSFGVVASQLRNLGSVKNAGVEVSINAQLFQHNQFGWDVTVAGSANENKVVSLGSTPPQIGTTSRIVAGYPISGYWARPITGYEDKNGDGLLTWFTDPARNEVFVGDSAIFRGYATPRYMTTLTSGWDLLNRKVRVQTMFDYRGGNKWYNNTERIRCTRPNCSGRMNQNATFIDQAMNIAANEHAARTLDGFFQPGGFVRLREASVQYNLPGDWARKLARARSASLVMTGRNLWLRTKYRGVDPESGFNTTQDTEAPSEFQTIGPPSYFIFRVNLGF
jgi:TonB-linked SusC/RagA family outer membrane protein